MQLLEKYKYTDNKRAHEIPGSKIIRSVSSRRVKSNKKLKRAINAACNYLCINTPPTCGMQIIKSRREPLVDAILDKEGNVLELYVYLIHHFYEIGHRDNVGTYWVSGYFDKHGTFMGRGTRYDDSLEWSLY